MSYNFLNRLYKRLSTELNIHNVSDEFGLLNSVGNANKNVDWKQVPESLVLDVSILQETSIAEKLVFSRWGFAILTNFSYNDHRVVELLNDSKFMVFRAEELDEEILIVFNGFTKINQEKNKATAMGFDDLMRLVSGRKIKPKAITLAFIGSLSDEKHGHFISECSKNYETKIWQREKNFRGFYNSFSQIINESVYESESEFIFWIHPRVTVNFEMLDDLILLLCSGYAFASEINFGFFGCSKQVFRKIGLLDERFIGSEHEDTDWFFRMKFNNIPSFERGNTDICPDDPHVWGVLRGLGHTIFEEKWVRRFDDLGEWEWPYNWCLSKFYNYEKQLNDGKNNLDIEKTWGNLDISHGVSFIPRLSLSCNLHDNIFEEYYETIDSSFNIKLDSNSLFVEFLCPVKTFVVITVHDESAKVITSMRVLSNQWSLNPIYKLTESDYYEIRVNSGQYRVFHGFMKLESEQIIKTGIKIKRHKEKQVNLQE